MLQDLTAFCDLFCKSTGIPIICYDTQTEEQQSFPTGHDFEQMSRNHPDGFFSFSRNPDYFVSSSFGYYGFIAENSLKHFLIAGPVFSTVVTDDTLRQFMHEFGIPPQYRQEVADFLCGIPRLSYSQFLHTLAGLHYCINDEMIDVPGHFHMTDASALHAVTSEHSRKLMDAREKGQHHNTYHFERQMLQFVQDGEADKLRQLLQETASQLSVGAMADHPLRQRKNEFIALATMVCRSAIAGGLDVEQAYQLSDVYVLECERSNDLTYINNLSYTMLVDYTQRVAGGKMPGGMSKEVFDCVQYITRHVNEPIQVGDVAAQIGRSRSYLTARFKEELGFNISDFIMRCRLEEARSLLHYTEQSLSEISSYLCFSSQAYFQNVFKKKYGITPAQYRKKTQKL